MSNERTMILKMLAQGKISVDEAEALIKATEDSSDSGIRIDEEDAAKNRKKQRKSGKESFGQGLRGFLEEMDESLEDTMKSFSQSLGSGLKEGLKELKDLKIDIDLQDLAGKKKAGEERSSRFDLDEVTGIIIENRWGDIQIFGEDRADVEVNAFLSVWGKDKESAKAALSASQILWEKGEGRGKLSIQPGDEASLRRIRADLIIRVPKELAVSVKSLSGEVMAQELAKDLEVTSLSGDLVIKEISGHLALNSTSGDIQIKGLKGGGKVNSSSGDILINGDFQEDLFISSISGDIKIVIPSTAELSIQLKSTSGDCLSQLPLDDGNPTRGNNIKGKLNGGGSQLKVTAVSGDIQLKGN